ncbi:MAG: ABC transporter ATP-binding protein [Candidatus Aminicenantes bacterium]|nr:ABC transporter ATP-binding protein [Candidatus Aminicenantes bacterium]
MDKMLELKSVTKKYKRFTLDNISLSLFPGFILGIIGPNGAGKTTTIKIIMDMVKADSGSIKVFGKDHSKNIKEIKNRIGYVGEEQNFYKNKSVSWTAKFVSRFYSKWDTNLFEALLSRFSISRSKKISELSKGMKVKLSLALALSHDPELIILDEPTAGLDPIIRRELLELLRKIPEKGDKSVIISSHITDDIARTADIVCFIVDGRIVLSSPKDDLLDQWKRIHYQEGALDPLMVNTLIDRREHVLGNSGITDRFQRIKDSLSEGMDTGKIRIENVTLDDILIAHVKER